MSADLKALRVRARALGLDVRESECFGARILTTVSLLNHAAALQFVETVEQLREQLDLFETLPELARGQFLLGVSLRGDGA